MKLGRPAASVASLSQEIWNSGDMLRAWGRGRGRGRVCLFASRGLDVRCRRRDVEEVWSFGGMLRPRGGGHVEVWSAGALEVRCRRVDTNRDLEACCGCRDV